MDRIIYDCDGVLLNWTGGFAEFLKHAEGISVDPEGPCSWDMTAWIGADMDWILERINRFNSNEGEFFANLKPLPGALSVVEHLRSQGWAASVLTACSEDPKSHRAREANLQRAFGSFGEIVCLGLGESKRPHLKAAPSSWFIEDNIGNLNDGVDLGHRGVLIEHRHNAARGENEPFIRAKSWRDVLTHVQPSSQPLDLSA